jgi:hypothetical protein
MVLEKAEKYFKHKNVQAHSPLIVTMMNVLP